MEHTGGENRAHTVPKRWSTLVERIELTQCPEDGENWWREWSSHSAQKMEHTGGENRAHTVPRRWSILVERIELTQCPKDGAHWWRE
ncbi:hypothetical protein ElyMa_001915500 [Elysia marginata]|uniref:Uncharacterized protein n=1 Tax=Elysia marginata TaxID=1093978 RepID=A0AAV4ESS1_9GAST|nr:hypothetical protein ElyMa_001915500 [Elysia marginata]